jgi:Holliday junction resolvase RusA-like endonuclease
MHWGVKRALRRRLGWELRVAWAGAGGKVEEGRRKVKVHLYLPRRYDHDNAVGGAKVLIDAMRDVGLLKNDSLRWLDLELEQHLSKEKRIEVEIEEGRCPQS